MWPRRGTFTAQTVTKQRPVKTDNLVCGVATVIFRVYTSVGPSQLRIVTLCKWSVSRIVNAKLACSRRCHVALCYAAAVCWTRVWRDKHANVVAAGPSPKSTLWCLSNCDKGQLTHLRAPLRSRHCFHLICFSSPYRSIAILFYPVSSFAAFLR